jgi:hypothetical protein
MHKKHIKVFSRPRGQVLRHIGRALEEAVELLVEHHLNTIHTYKLEKEEAGLLSKCHRPRSLIGVRKQNWRKV